MPDDTRDMPNYRRLHVPGGTYFFTAALADRQSTLLTDKIGILRSVLAETRAEHGFRIDEIAIMPDHLHTVMTMQAGRSDVPLICNKIKSRFSRRLLQT